MYAASPAHQFHRFHPENRMVQYSYVRIVQLSRTRLVLLLQGNFPDLHQHIISIVFPGSARLDVPRMGYFELSSSSSSDGLLYLLLRMGYGDWMVANRYHPCHGPGSWHLAQSDAKV